MTESIALPVVLTSSELLDTEKFESAGDEGHNCGIDRNDRIPFCNAN